MRILVADKFEASGLAGLRAIDAEVLSEPGLEAGSLVEAIARERPEVLVVRSTRVTAEMLDAGPLALVVRAGAGVNTIDVRAASERGIHVANCPGKNAIAVAELTMGLLLALDRRIPDNVADLRAGRWDKKEYSRAAGVHGRTLGVLGLGSIGCEVIRRAHAFGLRIVAWSRRFAGEERWMTLAEARQLDLEAVHQQAPIRLAPTPADVAGAADALTVHVALGPETRGFVDGSVLARLKPGAYFLNTSRGEVVDAAALERATRDKSLRLGLDVFAAEPAGASGEFRDPLLALPLVYGTHHIGASTEQAQEAIAAETVRIVRSFVENGRVPNCVNFARRTPATHRLVVRHRDRPGVLAHVFERLRVAGLNVQETENVVFEGAQAAIARIHLDGEPDESTLGAIRDGSDDILDLRLSKLGG
ncbi:MAG TPA: NAD(P)-dependent oxidoreductase [Thermoanaerobaculia bacterium]